MEKANWEAEYSCPRCGETLTPAYVEMRDWGRTCPKYGLNEHPVFTALDELCGSTEEDA